MCIRDRFKTTSDKSGNIMKELLFKASELGVMIRFTPISEQNYDNWVGRQGKNRYIITLLGRTVTARHIAEVTRVVAPVSYTHLCRYGCRGRSPGWP